MRSISPSSFSREYLSVPVYQVMKPEVVSSSSSRSRPDEKASLPTKLISLILARSPSKMSKLIPTRLRGKGVMRSEEHTSELQSRENLVCRLLLEKKNRTHI